MLVARLTRGGSTFRLDVPARSPVHALLSLRRHEENP
jgi:hypothetical protein